MAIKHEDYVNELEQIEELSPHLRVVLIHVQPAYITQASPFVDTTCIDLADKNCPGVQ